MTGSESLHEQRLFIIFVYIYNLYSMQRGEGGHRQPWIILFYMIEHIFKFEYHQRQTVDKQGNIVAVFIPVTDKGFKIAYVGFK